MPLQWLSPVCSVWAKMLEDSQEGPTFKIYNSIPLTGNVCINCQTSIYFFESL